jgi:hypothetical protein
MIRQWLPRFDDHRFDRSIRLTCTQVHGRNHDQPRFGTRMMIGSCDLDVEAREFFSQSEPENWITSFVRRS